MKATNIITNTIGYATLGITIGTTLELIFSSGMGYPYSPATPAFAAEFSSPLVAYIICRVLYIVFGIICGFSCHIYKIERLSLVFASLLHLSICFATFYVIGSYLKWGIHLGTIFSFLIVYAVIYFCTWVYSYMKIRQLNRKLEN